MAANKRPKKGDNTCYYYHKDVAKQLEETFKKYKGSKSQLVNELIRLGGKYWGKTVYKK